MNPYRSLTALFFLALPLTACETEVPTNAVVVNAYPEVPAGGDLSQRMVIYKVWWVETLFPDPIAPGVTSTEYRSVAEHGVAVVLLAPGWDPASGTPPASLVVLKSKNILEVHRGGTLQITVSDETFGGSCAAKQQLPQADVDFVTERIFPAEFVNAVYDARTCTLTPAVARP